MRALLLLLVSLACWSCTAQIDGKRRDPATPDASMPPEEGGDGGLASEPLDAGLPPEVTRLPSVAELQCPQGAADFGSTPARLVRLNAVQYEKTLRAVLGAAPSFDDNPLQYRAAADRYSTRAASYTMTDGEFVQLLEASEAVATQLVAKLKTTNGCVGGALGATSTTFASCTKTTVESVGRQLFRRPLTPDESAAFTQLALDQQGGGRQNALSLALQSLMMAPDFLYRVELGAGSPDTEGRRRLADWELAAALSYTLTDAPPDATLVAAVSAGQLSTPEQVASQVARLVGDTTRGTSRFYDFMFEYLDWASVPPRDTVRVDRSSKEGWFNPVHYGYRDAEATVARWLRENGQSQFWKTALTSKRFLIFDYSFEAWGTTRSAHNSWGIAINTPLDWTDPNRSGFLSMPWFMINRANFAGHNLLVQRGKWVRENIMCAPNIELPILGVPPLPDTPNMTLREKMAVHTQGSCAGCHAYLDPFGLAFEGHDDVGRVRTTDEGGPVNESAVITGYGADIDGPVNGLVELSTRFANSPATEHCFVRQNFRYLFGRNEVVDVARSRSDGCTIAAAQAAYGVEGSYVALMTSLLTSKSFLLRQAPRP